MTAPHYYASTSGILVDRFLKYGLFTHAYGAGIALFADHDKATKWAQLACLAGASIITTTFFGLESEMIDNSAHKAVSAAMGVDPDKLSFTDYKHSSNIIANKAYHDLMRLQKYRYGTDLLFVWPILVEASYGRLAGKHFDEKGVRMPAGLEGINAFPRTKDVMSHPENYSRLERFMAGHHGWAMSPYAGKAVYWAYETFGVPKTGYYETIKLRENLEATGRDVRADDIKAIYQRTRNDQNLPMVPLDAKAENDALRDLCQRLADEYNKHDGKFGVPEIVYLIGEKKLDIYAPDNKTFSPEAVARSHKEIDHLLAVGLDGIREEVRQRRKRSMHPGTKDTYGKSNKSFVDRFTDGTVNTVQSILRTTGMIAKRPEEFISVRDPTNLINSNHPVEGARNGPGIS